MDCFCKLIPATYSKIAEQEDEPCNLMRVENRAIAMSYFAVGVVSSLIATPLNVYMVETLNSEPEMQSTIGILQSLPWSLKLAFGFLSDVCPLYGMRRKPYLTIGALVYSAAFVLYSLAAVDNVVFLAVCIFIGTLGLIQLDVMADTMCVERSRFEPEESKGHMQASCYSIRFGGSLVGAIIGASVCNKKEWGWGLSFPQVAFLNGILPFLLVTPWLYSLKERYHKKPVQEAEVEMSSIRDRQVKHTGQSVKPGAMKSAGNGSYGILDRDEEGGDSHQSYFDNTAKGARHTGPGHGSSGMVADDAADVFKPKSEATEYRDHADVPTFTVSQQLNEIWLTVQLRAVWRPMAFVYLFNVFQVPNVAWQSYLQLTLDFEPWVLGLTVTLGSFMTFAGVLAYKYCFFKASWRDIYLWSMTLTTFFSLMQLLLIFQINSKYLHLNNYFFSLGDDVITAYISGIQFLPVCIMYMRLCPDGAEGSSYSMLTTFGNIALVCASSLGNLLANVWDVSNVAMRAHDVSGLWRLSVLTSLLSLVPVSFLWLLPQTAEEQTNLAKSQVRSKLGGFIFLLVLFGSLTWTISEAVMELFSVWQRR